MTDADAPEPLDGDLVDELLSAQLDGEFDAAARDHGLTPDEALARLAATPGVDERRRALERAHAEIGTPVVLDDVARRRVLDGAKPPRRRADVSQWLVRSAGIAAAIAIVVGLVVVTRRDTSGDDSNSKAASAPSTTSERAAQGAAAPRVINDEEQLRAFLRVHRTATSGDAASQTPSSSAAATPKSLRNDYAATQASVCSTRLAQSLHVVAPASAAADVTHKGKPAIVIVFAERSGDFAVLYRPTDCHIYISTFAKR